MTNQKNGTLYIGVTADLIKRGYEHKGKFVEGFTKRYGLDKLVYYEVFDSIVAAIEREKKLKKYKREYKINLIEQHNPQWKDLYASII